MPSMKQLTVRGFDDELAEAIRLLERRDGTSLNQAALKLLRRGAACLTDRATAETSAQPSTTCSARGARRRPTRSMPHSRSSRPWTSRRGGEGAAGLGRILGVHERQPPRQGARPGRRGNPDVGRSGGPSCCTDSGRDRDSSRTSRSCGPFSTGPTSRSCPSGR